MNKFEKKEQEREDLFFDFINQRSKIIRMYEEEVAAIEKSIERTDRWFGWFLVFVGLLAAVTIGFGISESVSAKEAEPEVSSAEVSSASVPEVSITVEVGSVILAREYYDIPLSEELQEYIFTECEERGIKPEIVFGMIERESQFREEAIGDNGNSFGLMQIQPYWHSGRMERLGVTDLLDPFQNVAVGIDYLAELVLKYDNIEMALTAYNAGCTGAYNNYFSKGIYCSEYSRSVIENAENLVG